jgi:hypothetical protein
VTSFAADFCGAFRDYAWISSPVGLVPTKRTIKGRPIGVGLDHSHHYLKCSPFFGPQVSQFKVYRCLSKKIDGLLLGLVGTVESGLCFPSRCGNPRCGRISVSGASFHRPSLLLFAPFPVFLLRSQFSVEIVALAGRRNDDRQLPRPSASPVSTLLALISLFQSRSLPASGSSTLDADARDCKTQNTFSDGPPLPAHPGSPSDIPLRTSPSAINVR